MYGTFSHTIDKKGRLFFPAKFREEMGEKLIVFRSFNGKPCLFVYSEEEFKKLEASITEQELKIRNPLEQWIFFKLDGVSCDQSGRIIISEELRNYAGLQKNIVIAGMSNRVEIWDKDKMEAQGATVTAESIASMVEGLKL